MKRLKEEFVKRRETGFAWDIGDFTPGLPVISAPVFSLREKLIGCLGLIGVYPKSKIEEYGTKVVSVAKQIFCKLGAYAESTLSVEGKQKKIEKAKKGNVLKTSGEENEEVLVE
jgi:hypothetical protein